MNPKSVTTIRIENRTIFKVLIGIVIFIGLLGLAQILATQLIWIASAFFLAIALNPAVEFFKNYMPRQSRASALAVVMLLALSLLFFLAFTFVPLLIDQSTELIESLPQVAQQIQNGNGPVAQFVDRHNLEQIIRNAAEDISKAVLGATGSVVAIASGVFNGFAAAFTILTLAIFMLLEGPRWNKLLWRYHPNKTRQRNLILAEQMYDAVSSYFTGILLIATISAVVSTIMMTIVGIPYAIPLGLVVGLFGLIPFIGATLAAVLVVVVAFFTSTGAGIVMAIYFIIYQQIENNILQPIIQGRSTELSPLIVTIAIILGAAAGGLFGALIAIPVAASIKVLVVHWVKHHNVEVSSKG